MNVAMGLMVLTCMLVVNSPLLDFRKIVVHSQLALLEKNKTTVADFDIRYFRQHLARPGYLALEDLKKQYADSEPEFIVRINSRYANRSNNNNGPSKEEYLSAIQVISGAMPDSLANHLYSQVAKNPRRTQNVKAFYLVPVDLNDDKTTDYLYIEKRNNYNNMTLYFFTNGLWLSADVAQMGTYKKLDASFIAAIKSGEIKTIQPMWKDISINELRFQIRDRSY